MNVIFLSPHFPPQFYHFCAALKELGVNVLGIGDCPYDSLSQECRESLNEYYYLKSLEDYESVYRAAAFFISKYGRISFIDSQNEYWLELEAKLRTDFNITSGFQTQDMTRIKFKSQMKKGYKAAGVAHARYHMVSSEAAGKRFAAKVGYPLIAKPDNGVGAANTYKITDAAELSAFYRDKPEGVQFIMEEFVPGHVETFDGITDSNANILFCAGQVMAVTPMEMLHGSGENISYTQNVQATDLYEIGKKVVAAFAPKNRFFHFEFFRLDEDKPGLGSKGQIVGLEVNMRAPGGYIPDKMNFAYDVDVYRIWAESLVYDKNISFADYSFKRYVTHVGRSGEADYLHSPEEIHAALGEKILVEKEPPKSISGGMGSHVFLLKSDSVEELYSQARYILQRSDKSVLL